MTVVVAYKYAANPQDASVKSDGTVDWSRAKSAVSEYDPVAVTLGAQLAQELGVEVVGISVGDKAVSSSMAKKNAMSKGLDRGLVIADDATSTWNHTEVAQALAGLVKKIGDANIVLTGDASIDDGARLTSGLIAGYLGWPAFQGVEKVEAAGDGFKITQIIPGGYRTLSVSGSVVVSVASDAVTPKVPSMKDILAAGKKPVEEAPVDSVEVNKVAVAKKSTEKPVAREHKQQLFATADELAQALKESGIL
ncbi:electron transfer flavoprotein beta subunit/FixA family protein [Mobiluncus mulieris]|uniref:Electron transfer flavoprotein beta subunit/FixA family protein n=1 Tax=Mobiluncus mulieris TaxID=2052 RepID=A0A7Y0U144_9ACTO|nr:electron transfer flavoprotein beta subunit/FixA family protein [Mobiluncus mulieris]NMW65031.1 electron transfer flavoprotein beta subunit/FixA family protein [Mobiluncus mulieris]